MSALAATQSGQSVQRPWVAIGVNKLVSRFIDENHLKEFNLQFVMFNDNKETIHLNRASWRLIINGKDHPNFQWVLANDPKGRGDESLPPGEYLNFSYALGDWFKKAGTYKVVWKGDNFKSAPIYFRVLH
jgi:hypothetical protein